MSMIIYSLIRFRKTCQNLSVAGRMEKLKTIDEINDDNLYDIENRSNMLWQVDRILSECENKPQILLMENVIGVHGAGNEVPFRQWISRLENYGYQSYWNDLSATEFKIPQTRNRTFMVSILGNYNYTFPKKTKLELRLKDLLEPEGTVDEKYYLSDKMITGMLNTNFESYKLENKLLEQDGIANTIIARFEGNPQLVNDKPKLKIKKNIVDKNDVSGSLTATGMQSLNHDGCQLVSLKRGYSIEVKEEKSA